MGIMILSHDSPMTGGESLRNSSAQGEQRFRWGYEAMKPVAVCNVKDMHKTIGDAFHVFMSISIFTIVSSKWGRIEVSYDNASTRRTDLRKSCTHA